MMAPFLRKRTREQICDPKVEINLERSNEARDPRRSIAHNVIFKRFEGIYVLAIYGRMLGFHFAS